MTLQEKLNFFRYAVASDFRIGLKYEVIEKFKQGHQFIQKEVTFGTEIQGLRDFAYFCERNMALVRDDTKVSPEWLKAQEQVDEKTKQFLKDLKAKETLKA